MSFRANAVRSSRMRAPANPTPACWGDGNPCAPMAHGFPSPQHAGVGLAGARMRLDRTALARKLMDKGWPRLEAEQTAEQVRSEERRVGKEWRSRWSPY